MTSTPALGSTQPPIQWVPGVKRPGREADHSPPTSAKWHVCYSRLFGRVLIIPARAAQMARCSRIIAYEPDSVYQEGLQDIPEILLRSSENCTKGTIICHGTTYSA
jgi:hypothetical protein